MLRGARTAADNDIVLAPDDDIILLHYALTMMVSFIYNARCGY